MKEFFVGSSLSHALRMRMVRCYIFSVVLYGCESWTLDPSIEKNIDAFEKYLYRRMLRISWTRRVTNAEVLHRMGKTEELLITVKERKAPYLEHVERGARYELLRLIIEGKIRGKCPIGRRQNCWLKDLRRWFSCSSVEVFRAATNKEELAVWIANLREDTAN